LWNDFVDTYVVGFGLIDVTLSISTLSVTNDV